MLRFVYEFVTELVSFVSPGTVAQIRFVSLSRSRVRSDRWAWIARR
jgi:hypothetical protein